MPSAFAKKQLEKFGWKEGDGLGKNADGVATYVRAHKRRGEATDCIGIGHEASNGTTNSDMGFDTILKEIQQKKKNPSRPPSTSSSDSDKVKAAETKPTRKRARSASGSCSSSSSSSDDDGVDDITKWDDAKLFARCNGVRLGRTGRHRYSNTKLDRAEPPKAAKK